MTDASGTAEDSHEAGPSFAANPNATFTAQDLQSVAFAVTAAGEASYHWDIKSDTLAWSEGAEAVLRRPPSTLVSGKHFAALLDPENLTTRYDTVINSKAEDNGSGVPYHIEYQLRAVPEMGLPATWVEDRGRWFADEDGRPSHAVGMLRTADDRHNRDQRLTALSHTDPLTGMMNRARLDEALEESIGEAKSNETSCAFAVATIRNLDVVNEAYGFEVADEVIAALAQRLRAVMRTGDGIARYSGSKFGFILNNCSGVELPIAIERFLNVARDSVIETSHGPVWALLSVGAVLLPIHADTAAGARALAEESLSAALRLSSDSYVVHMPSEKLNTSRMVNARCAAEIVECLKSNRFHLAFQPLVDSHTGAIACHEALLRMRDASGEVVTAGHLVPVAERLGLIRLVDRAVVQLALETLHRHESASLSINLSATTANDPRWNSQIIEMIEMAGEVARRLTIEITETTALTDLTSALAFLERLRSTGCCVAIDDFGAGFTSFRNLRDLPIDVIKLDGSYCRNLVKDSENVYFARTLIEMAHHFGIRTVAEWVETESDAEILRSLGVDFLQGNYMGAPDSDAPWAETAPAAFSFSDAAAASASPEAGEETAAPARPDPVDESVQEPVVPQPPAPVFIEAFIDETTSAPAMAEEPAAESSAGTWHETIADPEPVLADAAPVIAPEPAAETALTEPATGGTGTIGEASHEEASLDPLDDEVDESLSRLRLALDQLTRELAVTPAADAVANENGEDVRLAG